MERFNKLRGSIIYKSIQLYIMSRPFRVTYDRKGNMKRHKYTMIDFRKEFGVSVDTINHWRNSGMVSIYNKIKLIRNRVVPPTLWDI
jgi:hypothetical protein